MRAGLARLRELAGQNKADDFFAELIRLLQEKLGERLALPASAITEAVIDEKLRPHGLPDSTLDESTTSPRSFMPAGVFEGAGAAAGAAESAAAAARQDEEAAHD